MAPAIATPDNVSMIGLVAAYFNDPEGKAGYITSVSVLDTFMRKGIASTLVNSSIEFATERRFETITLEVEDSNERAVQFYKGLRFLEFEDRQATILFRLSL